MQTRQGVEFKPVEIVLETNEEAHRFYSIISKLRFYHDLERVKFTDKDREMITQISEQGDKLNIRCS